MAPPVSTTNVIALDGSTYYIAAGEESLWIATNQDPIVDVEELFAAPAARPTELPAALEP